MYFSVFPCHSRKIVAWCCVDPWFLCTEVDAKAQRESGSPVTAGSPPQHVQELQPKIWYSWYSLIFCFVILWNFLSHMKMKTMSSSSFSYLPSMFQGPNKMSSQGHQDPRISRCSCGPWDCLGYVRVLFQRSLRKLRSPCLCHVQHLPCFFLKARKSLRSLQFEVGRIEEISDCKVDLEIFSLK